MVTKHRHYSLLSFFNDPSLAKQWDEIEPALANAATAAHNSEGKTNAPVGWIEGRIHEVRSTQKETEILLVSCTDPNSTGDTHKIKALRIFITCPEFAIFVFAINQRIKVSLEGARIVHELVLFDNGSPPYSLIFSTSFAIQSVRGGICMPEGIIVDSVRGRSQLEECHCLDSGLSELTLSETLETDSEPKLPTAPASSSLANTMLLTPDKGGASRFSSPAQSSKNGKTGFAYNDLSAFPAFDTLVEGMMTPLLGIVETSKPPSTTSTSELCVSLTLVDSSSYTSGLPFRITCFTSKTRLARELPTPTVGSVVLFKSVKINKWPGGNGLIGAVYANKLDWITYDPEMDAICVPKHATAQIQSQQSPSKTQGSSWYEIHDDFYENLDRKEELFKRFIEVTNEAGKK